MKPLVSSWDKSAPESVVLLESHHQSSLHADEVAAKLNIIDNNKQCSAEFDPIGRGTTYDIISGDGEETPCMATA